LRSCSNNTALGDESRGDPSFAQLVTQIDALTISKAVVGNARRRIVEFLPCGFLDPSPRLGALGSRGVGLSARSLQFRRRLRFMRANDCRVV
jgi:hypothetical protein